MPKSSNIKNKPLPKNEPVTSPTRRSRSIIMVIFSSLALACLCFFFTTSQARSLPSHRPAPLTPLGLPYNAPAVSISKKLFEASEIPFTNNSGWLGFTLDYKYIEPVAVALNSSKAPLQTRGESHITVLTPPEFTLLATANVTQQEVNDIALEHQIQSTKFKAVCLGREELVLDGKTYIVYQVIVDAPALVTIRQAIFRLYASKGGNTALFDPNFLKPHITVAYTIGDLFEQNGVYKGYNVCYAPIIISK